MPTCHAKATTTPSRIEGTACNLEAALLIHSFNVGKDEMMPTRSIVTIIVSRHAMTQNMSFVRSWPSLKKAFEATMEDDLEKKGGEQQDQANGTERQTYATEKKGELKATIETHSKEQNKGFGERVTGERLDHFWKLWCEALENGYLEILTGTKEIHKKETGRGKITIVDMKPKRKDMATSVEEIRIGGGAYAVELLTQARICEEVARRLDLLNIHGGDVKAVKYIMLNKRALGNREDG